MKTTLITVALAAGLAGTLAAGPLLRDWKGMKAGEDVGTWADPAGSVVSVSEAEGPASGERALQIDSQLVQWGGAWAAAAPGGLGGAEGLHFQAKSDGPAQLSVMLTDQAKVQVEHRVRLSGGGAWEAFELPLASFTKTEWQDPGAPKAGAFRPAKLQSLGFSPSGAGHSRILVGPLSLVESKARLKDGQMGPDVVQDFVGLDAAAYGSFADAKGSRMAMTLKAGAPGTEGVAASLDYELRPGGWCGEWVRAGADWKGQDWGGAKAILIEAWCAEPVALQAAFNDANQGAYVADAGTLSAGLWTTLKAPLKAFQLNAYYQPPQAKKGAALDLSRVDSFNLSPLTEGKHQVWVRRVSLQR
jgi:hypothetical protein